MFWLFLCEHALKTVKPLPDGVDVPPWIADKKIGDYRLLASIGKGGFGEVFLAENRDGNRKAVKIFTPKRKGPVAFNLEYDGMRMAEFAGVHQNLVPIESVGRTEHCVYYTMPLADSLREAEYIPATLHNVLTDRKTMDEEELAQMALDILDALAYLHRKQLIHRDVKLDNILRFGNVWKLGDPGLLSPRRQKKSAGTPGFFINLKSHRTDESDDLYALGKVLYCAWTGMGPEHYPLVPIPYNYDRYARLRSVYRLAVGQKIATAEEFSKKLKTAVS